MAHDKPLASATLEGQPAAVHDQAVRPPTSLRDALASQSALIPTLNQHHRNDPERLFITLL
jgi:hypothetical protein